MKANRARFEKAGCCLAIALMVVATTSVLFLAGCGSGLQQKQSQFKEQWLTVIDALEGQVTKDDTQANDLAQKGDLAGLLRLIDVRIGRVDAALGKVLQLYPPEQMRRLQAITAYYLATLLDQLQAQKQLYEAAIGGRPTTDLQTIAQNLSQNTKAVASELGVELQKLGINLKEPASSGTTPTGK